MSSHRMIRILGMVGLIASMTAGHAAAETDLGQVCFGFTGVSDTVQLTATLPSGPALIIDFHFRWRGPDYQILGSGTGTPNASDADKFDIALVGSHNTELFGGNTLCSLYVTLDLTTGIAPFDITCTGSGGAPFTASGDMAVVSCG